MSMRDIFAAQIKKDQPTFIIDKYPRILPSNLAVGRTYVQVYRENLERTKEGLIHHMRVMVVVAKQGTSFAEDDLEGALDSALVSLERIAGLTWTDAKRVTLENEWNAYEISCSAPSANVYRTAALNS